ncbi:MAG: hypothetical protein U0797_05905 [Gemmataceae bacterium]
MGYALIWVECLAAALLLVAWLVACTARSPRLVARVGLPALAALLLVAAAGGLSCLLWLGRSSGLFPLWSCWYFLGWAVALTVGLAVLLCQGWKRQAGRAWPRGSLALALGVAAALACITFSNLDLAIKVQLAAVRTESGAKALALLPPRVADQDNAAPLYKAAFEALKPPDELPSPWKEKAKLWLDPRAQFDFQDKDLAAFLKDQERGVVQLWGAASRAGYSFNRDHFASAEVLIPELQKLRRAAALLSLDARARARRGDWSNARTSIFAIFGIARHANEPLLICLAVSADLCQLGVRTLQDVLAQPQIEPDAMLNFWGVETVSYPESLRRGLRMEEVGVGLPFLLSVADAGAGAGSQWFQDDLDPEGRWVLGSPFYRVFFLPDDLASYRRWMKAYQDLSTDSYRQMREDWGSLSQAYREDRGGILTRLILPDIEGCIVSAARADAALGLLHFARYVESYRATKGKYPDSIDELLRVYRHDLSIDPFDGKPLRFRRDGKDVVLYSVGPNGTDDGGVAGDEKGQSGDIVFRLRGR